MFAFPSDSSRFNARRGNPGCVAIGLVILLAAAIPARAQSKVDARTLEDRSQQIARMSPIERDHLERNISAFQQMTPAEQAHYRQLNQELENDQKSGGQLSSLLQTYNAWLQTLTPGQREQLRNEKDSARKLALVQQFKVEQQRQIEAMTIELPELEPPRQRPFGPRPLTASELQSAIKVLLADLPTEEQEKLALMPRPDQYRQVLERSVYHAVSPRDWPSARIQDELLAILPFERRQAIKRDPANQRSMLVGILCFSMFQQTFNEIHWPKEPELRQIEGELDEAQHLRISKLKPEDRRSELTQIYFQQNPDKAYRKLPEIRTGLMRLMTRIGVSLPRPEGDFPPRWPNERGPDRGPENRGPDSRSPERNGERSEPRSESRTDRPRPRGNLKPND